MGNMLILLVSETAPGRRGEMHSSADRPGLDISYLGALGIGGLSKSGTGSTSSRGVLAGSVARRVLLQQLTTIVFVACPRIGPDAGQQEESFVLSVESKAGSDFLPKRQARSASRERKNL